MVQEVKLPELGENIESVLIASVLVSEGDRIEKEQPLVEVETEKASMEVPSPYDGTVRKIHVSTGDQVTVGQVLVSLEAAATEPEAAAPTQVAEPADEPPPPTRTQVAETAAVEEPEVGTEPLQPSIRINGTKAGVETVPGEPGLRDPAPAAPAVRRLARELGVEIGQVPGSGPAGRISMDDVKEHARGIIQAAGAVAPSPRAWPERYPLPDLAAFGEVERLPVSSVRRLTAESMARSWAVVPHVTQQDRADVTELEAARRRFASRVEVAGGKLTVTAIVLKVVASALRRFPKFNAALDLETQEIVFRGYVHLGVAVDTERGLLVPVVRDADLKNIAEIAVALTDLADRARSKKLAPDEMRGAGFTVSNLGGLGTTYFSPIVNWPEAAILGIGRSTTEVAWSEAGPEPRLVLPLSLSYDHRLIDGAEAARFLRWIAEALEQPVLLALEG